MQRFIAALGTVLTLGLVGCGGGGGGGNPGTDAGTDLGSATDLGTGTDLGVPVCPFTAGTYPTAQEFCTAYGTTCGFGTANYYASMSACLTSYQAVLTAGTADCRTTHFCYVTSAPSVHCEHAAGTSLCQ